MLKELIKTKTMDKIKRIIGIILITLGLSSIFALVYINLGAEGLIKMLVLLIGSISFALLLNWLFTPSDNGVD